jgi:hypothetical protein
MSKRNQKPQRELPNTEDRVVPTRSNPVGAPPQPAGRQNMTRSRTKTRNRPVPGRP